MQTPAEVHVLARLATTARRVVELGVYEAPRRWSCAVRSAAMPSFTSSTRLSTKAAGRCGPDGTPLRLPREWRSGGPPDVVARRSAGISPAARTSVDRGPPPPLTSCLSTAITARTAVGRTGRYGIPDIAPGGAVAFHEPAPTATTARVAPAQLRWSKSCSEATTPAGRSPRNLTASSSSGAPTQPRKWAWRARTALSGTGPTKDDPGRAGGRPRLARKGAILASQIDFLVTAQHNAPTEKGTGVSGKTAALSSVLREARAQPQRRNSV